MIDCGTIPDSALGKHLIADFFGAAHLVNADDVGKVLVAAANACRATVLESSSHDFGERAGFTSVVLLAESHISVHTWPEHDYAAIDIFMCGDLDPLTGLDVLRSYFNPRHETVQVLERGYPGAFAPHVSQAV